MNKGMAGFFSLVFFLLVPSAVSAKSNLINGAGASFPYPIYSKWIAEYQKENPEIRINYQSIGSGGGIRQLLKQTVDFGASDAPMKPKEEKKAKTTVLHIPTVMGAVTLSYNLDLKKPLRLTGETIAEIFLGKIKKWNDAKLQSLNPGVNLPNSAITVVHRSDGSGTTAVFSDYLSKVSPQWQKKVGSGKALKWPTGLGGKGNEGVAGYVKQVPNSIGYIELVYALTNSLPVAAVKNKAGFFIQPSSESVSAASRSDMQLAEMTKRNFKISITNAKGKGAYPISTFTWLLIYDKMPKKQGAQLSQFVRWALSPKGQGIAKKLNYAPLPATLVKPVLKHLDKITYE